jgi:hypothetical protein
MPVTEVSIKDLKRIIDEICMEESETLYPDIETGLSIEDIRTYLPHRRITSDDTGLHSKDSEFK